MIRYTVNEINGIVTSVGRGRDERYLCNEKQEMEYKHVLKKHLLNVTIRENQLLFIDTAVNSRHQRRIDSTLPSFVINTEECLKADVGDDRKARVVILV